MIWPTEIVSVPAAKGLLCKYGTVVYDRIGSTAFGIEGPCSMTGEQRGRHDAPLLSNLEHALRQEAADGMPVGQLLGGLAPQLEDEAAPSADGGSRAGQRAHEVRANAERMVERARAPEGPVQLEADQERGAKAAEGGARYAAAGRERQGQWGHGLPPMTAARPRRGSAGMRAEEGSSSSSSRS